MNRPVSAYNTYDFMAEVGRRMKQFSFFWQAAGFCMTALVGTLLHFLYDWTGGNLLAVFFSGTNESTWEHMKLLFWPLFLFGLIQRPFFANREDFWCIKLAAALLGLLMIPILFYTYNGAFGKSPDWLNISIFYVSAAAAFLLEWQLFKKPRRCRPLLAFSAICLTGALFVLFTFFPPKLPLFRDPVTGTYGLTSPQ